MNNKKLSELVMCAVMLVACLIWVPAGVDAAQTISLSPNPINLENLPHAFYYTWGINFDIPKGEVITEAVLTFHNIYNSTAAANDLYIHLLDNPAQNVVAIKDWGPGEYFDNFSGQGVMVGQWSDLNGGSSHNFDLTYTFSALPGSQAGSTLLDDLNAYAQTPAAANKANFGFGIDPDCYYYNSGVTLTITTDTPTDPPVIPAPGALLLGGIGVSLVGWMRRRKNI